jgi:hypothetical protein
MTYLCPICLSLLVRPVTLECGHSLCESCIATLLQTSYTMKQQLAAPCPVLGLSCPCGPVLRIPRVNTLLHNDLQARYPSHYKERMREVESEEVQAVVRTVQDRCDGAVVEAGGGAAMGTQGTPLGANDNRRGIVHMRLILPFLLSVGVSMLLAAPGGQSGAYAALDGNGYAMFLASCPGSHWLLWRFLSVVADYKPRGAGLRGRGGEWAVAPPAFVLKKMSGFRLLPYDIALRVRMAGDLAPGLGFCCTWLMMSSLVEAAVDWLWCAYLRWNMERARGRAWGWFLATEAFILVYAYLWYELVSALAFLLAPFAGSLVWWLLRDPRLEDIYM